MTGMRELYARAGDAFFQLASMDDTRIRGQRDIVEAESELVTLLHARHLKNFRALAEAAPHRPNSCLYIRAKVVALY